MVRVCQKLAGWAACSRGNEPDPLPVLVLHKAHGFGDVAVVADDHRTVIGVQPTVVQQVHGEIDVRACSRLSQGRGGLRVVGVGARGWGISRQVVALLELLLPY